MPGAIYYALRAREIGTRVHATVRCMRCRREGVARSCLDVQVDTVRVQEWRQPAVVAANSSLALTRGFANLSTGVVA